jgi:hypothetical protein
MQEMVHVVEVHNYSNTIPDRYPEWVTEQDSIQVCYLGLEHLRFGKVCVPGESGLLVS